jgi:hypothetical protein
MRETGFDETSKKSVITVSPVMPAKAGIYQWCNMDSYLRRVCPHEGGGMTPLLPI